MARTFVLVVAAPLVVATAFFVLRFSRETQADSAPAKTSQNAAAKGGEGALAALGRRTPWATANFRGSPDPPLPYRAQALYPKLKFKTPTVLTSAPATDRLFVAEGSGTIVSLARDPDLTQGDLFLDVNEVIKRRADNDEIEREAIYGLAFHPKFTENRYCYVCYVVHYRDNTRNPHLEGTRVSRFTVDRNDPPQCDLASEKPLIQWLQGNHNGGCLKFGPDGFLYIATGDGAIPYPPDERNVGQDVTELLGSILRIDVDREQPGLAYAIPADNPFVALEGARTEIWAYGLRNPWKFSFDRKTGQMWAGDVGWELWELVFNIHKGDNCGWSIFEGPQQIKTEVPRGPTPIVPPVLSIPHTEGASITGGYVYRGKKFPDLYGNYIFGDWETHRIWGINVDGEKVGEKRELVEPTVRIVDFAEDKEGELYLLDYDDGSISTIVPNPPPAVPVKFPRRLSESGLFASAGEHRLAPGVLPFAVNSERWADGAVVERFVGVPGSEPIRKYDRARPIPGSMLARTVEFPKDSVLCETYSLEAEPANVSSRRRVETQVLHFNGRDWYGYTYEWTEDQSDAVLVGSEGKSKTLTLADSAAPGGKRQQTWRYGSRMECLRCHNPWTESLLGFIIPQLNRDCTYGGVTANQIEIFRQIGLLLEVPDEITADGNSSSSRAPTPAAQLPKLADPFDPKADLNARARSYLHANCSHCHRFQGGGSSFVHLLYDMPLQDMRGIGVRPAQGTFGIHDAKIIAAGDPFRSALYFRMSKLGPGHMPHLGSSVVDHRGLELVHDWIRQLPTRLEDDVLVDRLIATEDPEASKRDAQDLPKLAVTLSYQLASMNGRIEPTKEEEAAARQLAELEIKKRQAQRPAERAKLIEELLAKPDRAALLARIIRAGKLTQPLVATIVESAGKCGDAAVRDVFECFLPEELRVQRLGDAVKPSDLLKLAGDIERGRQLFHKTAGIQCRNCHKIGNDGTELGPNLDGVGKKYPREKLLENILDPSRTIEPKYATWLVETTSGRVISGLLVRKDGNEIVVKDAQNKEHRFATSEVEGTYQQQKSMMPDLLIKDFTAQQVADLLAYLESLK
ncbi:MAG: PQQ-dependent sugar dehydrogenase [Planctomycetaceae bacterium]